MSFQQNTSSVTVARVPSVRIDHVKRLPTLRERAKMRKTCGPYQWRPSQPGKGRGFYQSSRGLAMGDSTMKLRLELANDHLYGKLANIDGYYTDSFQDQTLQPVIARLAHGRGFLAGWTMGNGMCGSIDAEIHESASEAARAAHDMAEQDAEKEREREEQDRAEFEAEQAEEIEQ